MNKALYFVLGLLAGAVVGGIPTYLYMKKKVDDANDEINNMVEYYGLATDYDGEEDSSEDINPIDSDIKERLVNNYERTTNYAEMYSGNNNEEDQHPVDSDEDEAEVDYELETEEETKALDAIEATLDHQKNKDRKPKIISEDAAGDLPGYIDHATLFYYTGNDILTNEDDEEIEPGLFVGDALDKYGFRENDQDIMFVMNYSLDTCYEVQKLHSSFE